MKIVDSQIDIWENETMNAHQRQVRAYSNDDALKDWTSIGSMKQCSDQPAKYCLGNIDAYSCSPSERRPEPRKNNFGFVAAAV